VSGRLITVYWRDIPAQVVARSGRSNVKVQLPERFQVGIDRAAMRAGKGSSDAYLDEWRRLSSRFEGDAERAARAAAEQLDSSYDEERLERLVKAGGVEPTKERE
jgi:hypothetical protein